MKKTLLSLAMLLIAMAAQAQGYLSYFGADSIRLNVYETAIDHNYTYHLMINKNETVEFNGHSYVQGHPSDYYSGFYYGDVLYFREDTIMGRLYRYVPVLDEEFLLSDMSLAVGDTVTLSNMDGVHHAVVESVSFENGRKVIHFTLNYAYYQYMEFREGIFPDILPLGLVDYYWCCFGYLLCEFKDGEQVFASPRFSTCYISDDSSIQEKPHQWVSVYPTNVQPLETVHIETEEPMMKVALFDLFGREISVVCRQESSCLWHMTVPSDIFGIYIIRTTINDRESYEKIFIHH